MSGFIWDDDREQPQHHQFGELRMGLGILMLAS